MRKAAVLLPVLLFAAAVEAYAQHAPVTAGAKETPAAKLREELGGKKVLIIDVRGEKEFAEGHVPGAVNIPVSELSTRLAEMKVSKDTVIVTMCEHGGRSSRAASELEKLGYKSASFCRLEDWRKSGYKTEKAGIKPRASAGGHKFTCHHFCQSEKEVSDLEEKCNCACDKPYRECMKES
ncbi:MAG: rhodanese-like domain-containing protein [Terriglobia bacterium]